MEEFLTSGIAVVLGTVLVNGLTTLAKRFKIDAKLALCGAAVSVGVLYTLFVELTPVALQQSAVAFVSESSMIAVLIYEFFLKKSKSE